MRILAVADEVVEALYGDALGRLAPELILSCGDLPFEYLENLVTRAGVPLVYVPGNHDPDCTNPRAELGSWPTLANGSHDPLPGPQGGDLADGRVLVAAGLRIAGLGGSVRYKEGPNQYTQGQMRRRALRLEARVRLPRALRGRGVDVLLTHVPPLRLGDGSDPAHVGFAAFHRLIAQVRPRLMVHGHIHPYKGAAPDRIVGQTLIVNAIPYRLLEL